MASAAGKVLIGISGWRYEPWRGVFYPRGLAQRSELAFASRMLPTIEINGSFYSLQRPESYAAWHAETPPGFVFAVKGSRYITHMLKLRNVDAPLANFFASGVLRLNEKLGPILWQFPPQLGFDAERFDAFFAVLPRDTRGRARARRAATTSGSPAAPGSRSTARGRCATRSRSAIRASSIRRSSPCCGGTASPSSSPTPPAAGRCSRT